MWNIDHGDEDPSGMTMASVINSRINNTKADAFTLERPDRHFLVMDDQGVSAVNPKVYVMAQYSRHIKKGMKILAGGDPNTVIAYDPKAQKLVLVTQNLGKAQNITWDISNFKATNHKKTVPVRAWQTQTNGCELYHALPDGRINMAVSKRHMLHVPANSVVTLEIKGVQPLSNS